MDKRGRDRSLRGRQGGAWDGHTSPRSVPSPPSSPVTGALPSRQHPGAPTASLCPLRLLQATPRGPAFRVTHPLFPGNLWALCALSPHAGPRPSAPLHPHALAHRSLGLGVLRTLSSSSKSGPLSLGFSMSKVSYSRSRSSSASGTRSAGSCSESRTCSGDGAWGGTGLGGSLQGQRAEGTEPQAPLPAAAPVTQAPGDPGPLGWRLLTAWMPDQGAGWHRPVLLRGHHTGVQEAPLASASPGPWSGPAASPAAQPGPPSRASAASGPFHGAENPPSPSWRRRGATQPLLHAAADVAGLRVHAPSQAKPSHTVPLLRHHHVPCPTPRAGPPGVSVAGLRASSRHRPRTGSEENAASPRPPVPRAAPSQQRLPEPSLLRVLEARHDV